ncbi:ribose 5-phosphate isomerase, type A [Kipferlia bialata]|uniref:ribose-5-phosphate isomerase n=1 Tax=Kipferlia bialata TaxID=797122 RepID=A0A391NPS0_9EUKA|nr:ribose 5-phosphate isomerase, type A [Kipferlia bialata]|eukprot:g2640.t1
MEAYRLPSHVMAAKVRLHVGDLAPTSCFIGRPTFEGLSFNAQWPHDQSGDAFGALARLYCQSGEAAHDPAYFFNATLLKAAHQTASACSAMFEAGIIDAKVAIENMTESQAVFYMKAVVANVRRDPERQRLSAAFNINRPLYSDTTKTLLTRDSQDGLDEIIKTVVDITRRGHFDKVTLDGASERKGTSVPVVNQLTHRQMLHFVHTAHEAGLLTYLSAGIDATNLHKAVSVGVDGMGIGFALHAKGPDGVVAALSVVEINKVLAARDAAENTTLGAAAKALAHLDTCHCEGSITEDQDRLRMELYAAMDQDTLDAINQTDLEKIMRQIDTEVNVSAAGVRNPILSHAAQVLDNRDCHLAQYMPADWEAVLRGLVERTDIHGLRKVLSEAQSSHRAALGGGHPDSQSGRASSLINLPQRETSEHKTLPTHPDLAAQKLRTKITRGLKFNVASAAPQLNSLTAHPVDTLRSCCNRVFLGEETFPPGMTEDSIIREGGIIVKPGNYLPFSVDRTELYSADDLLKHDLTIYNWFKHNHHNCYDHLLMALHDGVILDLLEREYAGKKQVGIMGGHAMLRDSKDYISIAKLCRTLALQGYVVATGGGPGAMEAANLGAHFSGYSEAELDKALHILQRKPDYNDDRDNALAIRILARWPKKSVYSLGVPTWVYGQEPPNLFCKYQAKFFSNAVREDILVLSCNCGIIYTAGSAGTRTEIAQYAVANCYSQEIGSDFSKPMIFYGNFWVENTLYQTYLNMAQRECLTAPRPELHYSNKLFCTDSEEAILSIVSGFYHTYYPFDDIDRGVAPTGTPTRPHVDTSLPVAKRAKQATSAIDIGKRSASYLAVEEWVVRDGMVVGVGSGTTVEFVVDRLAQLVQEKNWTAIVCVPTSYSARALLAKYPDVLTVRDMLSETRSLDVAIDGADEVDSALRLIKGGGGALLHEQVVGQSADHYVVVADMRKDSVTLGHTFHKGVPIEVQPLAWRRVRDQILAQLQVDAPLRLLEDAATHRKHTPYVTDNGNYLLDATLSEEQLQDPNSLLATLKEIAGVCAVGIFPHLTTVAYFGNGKGEVVSRTRVETSDANMLVSPERQQSALESVLSVVRAHATASERPVVELDLDLTSLLPYRRTIAGIAAAADAYGIVPLQGLVQEKVSCLPGYTAEAWNEWLRLPEVASIVSDPRYSSLPWIADDAHKDTPFGTKGATVHSAFHRRFWLDSAEMADDIPTEGLADLEERVHEAGGQLVFVSGRWKQDMISATHTSLSRAGLRHPIQVVIGNPGHDTPGKVITDAEAKVLLQREVAKYGTPVAYIDDRKTNLDAVAALAGNGVAQDFVTVVACVPGYSAADYHKDPSVKATSNLYVDRVDPRAV